MELCLAAQSLEADYRDCESSNPFPLLVTRRLLSSCAKHEANNAMSIRIRKLITLSFKHMITMNHKIVKIVAELIFLSSTVLLVKKNL